MIWSYFTSHPVWLERGATALITCATIALLTALSSLIRTRWQPDIKRPSDPKIAPNSFWPIGADGNKPLIRVHQKTFSHETVPLDGREYIACTFEDVTFEFEGKAAFGLPGSRLIPTLPGGQAVYRLKSNNPVVVLAMQFAQWSGVGQLNRNNPWKDPT